MHRRTKFYQVSVVHYVGETRQVRADHEGRVGVREISVHLDLVERKILEHST